MYQPKTGQPCSCKRGVQRDNCPECEGTGQRIDFRAIREAVARDYLRPYCKAHSRFLTDCAPECAK